MSKSCVVALVTLCMVLLHRASLVQAGPITFSQPNGNYAMQAVHSQNVKDSVLLDPRLTGFLLRDSWDLLEPSRGVFDFTWYDAQLARALRLHKHVTLALYAGDANKPSWVSQSSALTDFTAAIQALGQRYSGSAYIDAVHFSAPLVTDRSAEAFLPASWHYPAAQAVSIWQQSIAAYDAAFPDKTLVLDVTGSGVVPPVAEYARSSLGPRFEAVICSLKASTSVTAPHVQELEKLRGEGTRIGFEFVGPSSDTSRFGGSFTSAYALGQRLGGSWFQVYQYDVPSLPISGAVPEPDRLALFTTLLAAAYLAAARRRFRVRRS